MKIGTVAQLAGVSVQTILYYERQELIPRPSRSAANYRVYAPKTIKLLRFIKCAQQVGFTLQEIKKLIFLRNSGARSCADVKELTEVKLAKLEKKASELRSNARVLARLVAQCSGDTVVRECPIIVFLDTRAGT